MRKISSESDWKVFREVRAAALERFCRGILAEIAAAASEPGKTSHERYLAVYKIIDKRDDEIATMFNDPRRSTALVQLAAMRGHGLVTDQELDRFSADTRDTVRFIVG